MTFLETIRSALSSLRSNAMRTVLTLLGMIIGVFAIIVAVTAVQVIDVYFKESLQILGSSTFSVSKTPVVNIGGGSGDRSMRNRPDITYQQIQRLQRNLDVPAEVSMRTWFDRGAVRYQDRETEPNIQLTGTDEHFLRNYSYDMEEGRFFTSEDVQFARSVAVLGYDIAELLFPQRNAYWQAGAPGRQPLRGDWCAGPSGQFPRVESGQPDANARHARVRELRAVGSRHWDGEHSCAAGSNDGSGNG